MGRKSKLKKQRNEQRRWEEEKQRRPFLAKLRRPAVIGAAVLLVAVLAKYTFFNERKQEPKFASQNIAMMAEVGAVKRAVSKNVGKDADFAKFRTIFSKGQISYGKAVEEIKRASGVDVKEHDFSLPDSLGVGDADKFYNINFLPIVFPPEFKTFYGTSGIQTNSFNTFETWAADPEDGRVKALADYILTKYGAGGPQEAAETISSWTMNNIEIDVRNASVGPMNTGKGKSTAAALREAGYGVTHNHPSSANALASTGVCIDYTNVSADMLNSVGIPSRTVAVSAYGIHVDKIEYANKIDDILATISHSLLQVQLPSGTIYYEATPMLNNGVPSTELAEVTSPADYIAGRLERRHPDVQVFRIGVFASLPSDRFSDDFRRIFDKGFGGVDEFYRKATEDSTFLPRLAKAIMSGGDYDIHFWDAFVNAGY